MQRHEATPIPEDFDYSALSGMTLEAREKLSRIRPKNLAQAGRVPGVSPADQGVLAVALLAARRQNEKEGNVPRGTSPEGENHD